MHTFVAIKENPKICFFLDESYLFRIDFHITLLILFSVTLLLMQVVLFLPL